MGDMDDLFLSLYPWRKVVKIMNKNEKVIQERDRMNIVHALSILIRIRELCLKISPDNLFVQAIDVVLEYIFEMSILENLKEKNAGGDLVDQD